MSIPQGATVIGTLLNFYGALQALGNQVNEAPYKAPPKYPVLYIKPENTWSAAGAPIAVPADVKEAEIGATFGIVIGRSACRVSAEEALDFVAGYTAVNDLTVPHASVFRPAIKGRCRDGFCAFATSTTARAAVKNPDDLKIRAYVNGELRQESSSRHLIRPVAQLIADVTAFMTLSPGDVLLVGVPENSPKAQVGDRVAVEIEGIGRVENTLVAEVLS